MAMMLIKIDGREVEAFPGETILQIARREDIFIPSLCTSAATEPTNSCRLCMIEVKDRDISKRTANASCAAFVLRSAENSALPPYPPYTGERQRK